MKLPLLLPLLASCALAQTPPYNYLSNNCPGHVVGSNSLLWIGPTDKPACIMMGPTLQWSNVSGRAQIDVAPQVLPPATMFTRTGDLAVTWTSSTVLTIGANCSAVTPCNVAYGEAVAQFMTPGILTLIAGTSNTGIIRVYVDGNVSPPIIRVSMNGPINLTCASIACATDTANGFPVNSIPLASWTADKGAWDVQGGVDYRAALRSMRIVGGPGISAVCLNGTCTISIDPNQ